MFRKAYPLDALESQPVLNDSVEGQDALIYFDVPSGTALVYDRNVNGRTLTFGVDTNTSGVLTTSGGRRDRLALDGIHRPGGGGGNERAAFGEDTVALVVLVRLDGLESRD